MLRGTYNSEIDGACSTYEENVRRVWQGEAEERRRETSWNTEA